MGSTVSSDSVALMGMGVSLPARRVTSAELDQKFGWKPGKLERLCGVRQRPVISADETQESMGTKAAIAALADAGITASDLDLLLFAAAVGRQPIPATAPLIKRELGLARENFPAFDVNATCLSALAALDMAALYINSGRAKYVLVVASEIASRALPWQSAPRTAGLFGDGAAALVLSASPEAMDKPTISGFHMETYADGYDHCALRSGGTRYDFHDEAETFAANAWFDMDGRALYKLTSAELPGFITRLLAKSNLKQSDVDLVVPHQASPHALAHMVKHCGFAKSQVFDIVADMGNQVAASLPIALHEARAAGRLDPGMKVMLIGTSAGVSLGGAIVTV